MPYYYEKLWIAPLTWQNIFEDVEQFIEKVGSVGTDTENLDELYELLSLKYMYADTRYIEEEPFIMGLKRELMIVWPIYLQQKALMASMMELEIADIMVVGKSLTNRVDTNDSPVVDADSVPISDLSTSQSSSQSKQGVLASILAKYESIRMDYVRMVYAKADQLFKKILSKSDIYVYDQLDGEENVEV